MDKHIAITGATSGIGRATTLELASRGAALSLLCRDIERAEALAMEVKAAGGSVEAVIHMDMNALSSVRSAAAELTALSRPLDVLLNNAGIVNTSRQETADGFEATLAVNHFAPFLLTGLALPALQAAATARIVTVASDAHHFVRDMGFDDMHARKKYKTFREYGRSKLANILFTRELARRLSGQSITANCLHPGAVSTSLGTQNGWLGRLMQTVLKPFFRTPQNGAETSIFLCTSDEVATVNGAYFVDCKPREPKPWAKDDEAARQLWAYTEEAVDFTYPL